MAALALLPILCLLGYCLLPLKYPLWLSLGAEWNSPCYSALWRVAYKLFWIFCGHVYIHPPTCSFGPVNSLSGLVHECLHICVYISCLSVVYVLSLPTYRWRYIGLFILLCFYVPLPTTPGLIARVLIMHQGKNLCMIVQYILYAFQSYPNMHPNKHSSYLLTDNLCQFNTF